MVSVPGRLDLGRISALDFLNIWVGCTDALRATLAVAQVVQPAAAHGKALS